MGEREGDTKIHVHVHTHACEYVAFAIIQRMSERCWEGRRRDWVVKMVPSSSGDVW